VDGSIAYQNKTKKKPMASTDSFVLVLTCANKSPSAQPTREVKALAVNGWSSRALLYASQPGTAPPRTIRAGSRNSGLLTEASLVRKAGPAMEVVGRKTPAFVTEGFGVTPKALTAKVDETKRRLRSFMMMILLFGY
jgi:hypothetical protein